MFTAGGIAFLFVGNGAPPLVKPKAHKGNPFPVGRDCLSDNQILKLLPRTAQDFLLPFLEQVKWERGESLFEPGDNVTHAHFPLGPTVISFILPMRDGRAVEAATIGREGAVGGIVSLGLTPAFN